MGDSSSHNRAAHDGGAGVVMVVDDEQLIRWSIRQHLEKAGYRVTTAESGEQALAQLEEARPEVVLLDVRLPGIDGLQVLAAIRERAPEVAVVMLSAHATIDIAVGAMKQGASDFLTKPFDLSVVESTLARTLETVRLRRTVAGLSAERSEGRKFEKLVGSSAGMVQVRSMVEMVARSSGSTVLIRGESGTGKDVVARSIHFASARAEAPYMAINCTSLPEPLVESELFGHERGAFTDAKAQKRGLFELVEGGTVLLDEIGDMPLGSQAKLLRVLEEKRIKRVGGTVDRPINVRVVAATHRDLSSWAQEGRFRLDLYFRLNIVSIVVPALRDHLEDLPELCAHFIARNNHEQKRQVQGISDEAMLRMLRHSWPGNVRELRNVIERAFILDAREMIGLEHLPEEIRTVSSQRVITQTLSMPGSGQGQVGDLDTMNREMIQNALEKTMGNQTQAAKLLGISRDTLRYRLKKFEMN